MEPAELLAKIESLEKAVAMAKAVNAEVFYWWCTALMIAIHAGFLAYEMGASRAKNALASGIKNLVAFAFIVITTSAVIVVLDFVLLFPAEPVAPFTLPLSQRFSLHVSFSPQHNLALRDPI